MKLKLFAFAAAVILICTAFMSVTLFAGKPPDPGKVTGPAASPGAAAEPSAGPEYCRVRFYSSSESGIPIRFTVSRRGDLIDLEVVYCDGTRLSGFSLYGDEPFMADYTDLLLPDVEKLYAGSKDFSGSPVPSSNVYFSRSLCGSFDKVAENVDENILHCLGFACIFHKNAFYGFTDTLDDTPAADAYSGENGCAELLIRIENGFYYRYRLDSFDASLSCDFYDDDQLSRILHAFEGSSEVLPLPS